MLPILVLLVFGIVEFGRAYNAKIELTAAVREGARAGALGNDAVAATRSAAPGLNAGSITVTTVPCSPGANATVTAQYPFQYDVPFFGSRSVSLRATGVMRCGG